MGFIFNRNKFYLSILVIDLLVSGGFLFCFIVVACIISIIVRKKRGHYDGERKDGMPHGKGVLYLAEDDPIEKIQCDTFKEGKIDGIAKFFIRDKNGIKVSEYKFLNDHIIKDISKKPNIAYLAVNQDIRGPGDMATRLGYQDKYGVFKTYEPVNGRDSLNAFVDAIKNNDNINVIKIGLLNHGGEKGDICDTHGADFRNILEKLCYEFKNTNKKIYIVNHACFGAEKFEDDPEYKSLKETIYDISKKYGNKIILAQHSNKDTTHMVWPTYDEKTKYYGIKHFHLKYSLVDCGKETKNLSKEEKNNILYGR